MKLTQQHFDSLKKAQPLLEALGAVNVLLGDQAELSSLEQAHREASNRLSAKRDEEQTLDGRIAAVAGIEADAQELLRKAREDADKIRDEARTEAGKEKETAQQTATGILDRSKAQALKITQDARAALPAIEQSIEEKRTEFTELADACDDKRKELTTLNKDIEQAEEHIRKLLKGRNG